ncbi:MAG TPA: response regulator [Chloroflexota bacterium]|jgi:CheY-like chemotaxis protein|nr:response regulator [Chloroflexota bacterium]
MAQPPPVDVLVVDDEPAVAELLLEVLRDDGLSATAVADGRQVLEAVQRYRPRLILLDVMLPGLTGPQVLRWLAASGLPLPPVILMSAAGVPKDRPPDVRFLPKPFNLDDLLAAVHEALERGG